MASQQPRPLFRFASMVRPASAPQPPAPTPVTAVPQPLFRPTVASPFRPPPSTTTTTTATTVTATQPTQPQEPTPQTPAPAPVTVQAPAPPQPQQQPVVIPRSPILAPQPQPVAAASPLSAPPAPRSPVVAPAPVVSPPKVPTPRSPPVAAPVPRSPVNNVTPSVPQSPFKKASDVTTVSAPTSTPYSSLPPSPKTKMTDSIQNLFNQSSSSPSKAPSPSQKVTEPLAKTQTHSPQVKPAAISHPPSPLKLPPPQLDLESNKNIPPQVDQKSVVVQETTTRSNNINGHHHVPQSTRNGKIVENGKREVLKGVHQHKKISNSDTEDFGMSVLTLAGENKGAIMELSPSRNKNNSPQSLQKKLGSPKAWSSTSSEDESGSESGKAKKRDNKMPNNKSQLPMTAFMNSNVQGVNNSILHNTSCTHHDPGVHLVFSRKTNGHGHGHGHGFHIKASPKS